MNDPLDARKSDIEDALIEASAPVLNPCYRCNSPAVMQESKSNYYWVECDCCILSGPMDKTKQSVAQAWNHLAERGEK